MGFNLRFKITLRNHTNTKIIINNLYLSSRKVKITFMARKCSRYLNEVQNID